jgi:hypothetical protein
MRARSYRSTGTLRSANCAAALSESYCQIYCQKREGEGIPGGRELQVFSNLLISICVYVGSNPTLSATRDINSARSGSVDRDSNEAGKRPLGRPRIMAWTPLL